MTNILIVGDFIIDHYIEGSIGRQSPEDYSIPIIDVKNQYVKMGGAGNLASAVKRLKPKETSLDLLSIYPKDSDMLPFINKVKTAFFEPGISWLGSWALGQNCIIKTRIINSNTKKQVLRLDTNKSFQDYDIKCVEEYIQDTMSEFRKYDYIIVSDYNKGVLSDYVINTLNKFDGLVFVDTKKPDLSVWDNIKNCIIKVNTEEWVKSNKKTFHPIIITRGAFGADLIKDGKKESYPTNNEYIYNANVIGAGDNFLAGFVIKYIETKDFVESIKYANKVASDAVSKPIGEC